MNVELILSVIVYTIIIGGVVYLVGLYFGYFSKELHEFKTPMRRLATIDAVLKGVRSRFVIMISDPNNVLSDQPEFNVMDLYGVEWFPEKEPKAGGSLWLEHKAGHTEVFTRLKQTVKDKTVIAFGSHQPIYMAINIVQYNDAGVEISNAFYQVIGMKDHWTPDEYSECYLMVPLDADSHPGELVAQRLVADIAT